MGLTGGIAHFLIKTALGSLIIWILLVAFMQISVDKMPMLMIVVALANFIASIVAHFLLMSR